MTRTTQFNLIANTISQRELLVNIGPHRDVKIGLGISNQVHSVLGSAEKNIDSILCTKETYFALCVASNQGYDDDFGFLALKVVDCGKANGLEELLLLDHLSVASIFCGVIFESFLCKLVHVTVTQTNLEILA